MNITKAAKLLLDSFDAPPGSISVWTWSEGEGVEDYLIVNINSSYWGKFNIPDKFEGYKVSVRKKEDIIAL